MIIVIDYNMGNAGSVLNMLKKVGAKAKLSQCPQDLTQASKLVLPGVGSFDDGMLNLQRMGYIHELNRCVLEEEVPILGICLGLQLFTRRSEEGRMPGLGWVRADTVRFRFDSNNSRLKIPHMGWNKVRAHDGNSLLKTGDEEERFYFVHSYHVLCDDEASELASTKYGYEFTSAIVEKNIIGTQFHPEKSHRFGMEFFKRFIEWDAHAWQKR